ncbi:MAG: ATP-binding cassette domain-containing protein [Propionibacteriaceae bacterium]|jgi:ABC-type lipoprotein export system ATPase subunit|nr:ATP-binding cassette domain-containing protein [Propionibacteriaceae bacterium]
MRVALDQVGHRFTTQNWLFRHLTYSFDEGTTTAVTGPSGSGKSTLLAIIAGSLAPTEGQVNRTAAGRVRWVFQNPLGVPRRSAIDHVVLPYLAQGTSRKTARCRALDTLELFDLLGVADRLFADLSGGEAQRLMLARAVASTPDLLLVDEPTAQLDRHAAETVASVLSATAVSGAAVIVATHDPLARQACGSIVDLSDHAG